MSSDLPGDVDPTTDVGEFVTENEEFLARILAFGDAEGRSYALTLLANGGNTQNIEKVQRTLEEIKQGEASDR